MSEADNSTFEWTQDLTINLAELLEGEHVLWDKSHPDYKKGNVKHDALKRMADIFGTTALVVQCKLNNIRSQFLREEKKVLKKRTSAGGNYVSKWFLYDYLKFLSGCAETKNSSRVKESQVANIVTEEEIVTINDDEDEERIFPGEHEEETVTRRVSREACKNYQRRKIENLELRRAVVALSNNLLEHGPNSKEKEKDEDDCDIFGRLVAKRMRLITSPVIRLVAEQEISSCIARKICEDSGIEMTTVSAPIEWSASISKSSASASQN